MKYISFLFLCIFLNINSNAQTPFHNPIITVGSSTYNCQLVARFIRVVNQTNTVSDEWLLPPLLPPRCAKPRFAGGFYEMQEGIKSVFSPTRWNELKNNEETLFIYYYFNMDGTVKEVWFRLELTTILTPAEILAMEHKIKSHVVVLDNANCMGLVSYQRMNRIFEFK